MADSYSAKLDTPESIVRCIDIDRLCEEERIRRLGERIRRDRDESCELSRERRARGLSRELLASGFNVALDSQGSSGFALSGTTPLIPPPTSDVRSSHGALASTTPVTNSGPPSTFAGAGFGLSFASVLAEEDFGRDVPATSSSSTAIDNTLPTFGYPKGAGQFGAPPTVPSSTLANDSKVSVPNSRQRSPHSAKSTSPSAVARLRKPNAVAPRATSPGPGDIAIPMRPEEVEEQQRILRENEKEVREIKAMESQIMWELHREEKSQVKTEKKEAELDIMAWRNELASGMKEIAEATATEQKQQDLEASKNFQAFKRDRKQVVKEEELQLIKEQYEADVEFAQMQAEIAKTAALDRHAMVVEHLEEIEVIREKKAEEKVQQKVAVEQERALEQRLKFNHQATQLSSQKEELLRNLQMMRSVQKQPVCTSGRAGRPRGARQ